MVRRRRPPRAGALTELPPLKILSQIVALQALYYGIALILLLFTVLVTGTHFSLNLLLGWNDVRGDTTQGWLLGFIWVLDGGLFMAAAIVIIVERSKLVLDFALSLHFIHLVVVTLYTRHLPRNLLWWLVLFTASIIAVALATWGCRNRELKPISFGGSATTGDRTDTIELAGGSGAVEDDEDGLSRGRGRGRGRDGAGDYEMVSMNGHGGG